MTIRHYLKEQPISYWKSASDKHSHETNITMVITNFFILGVPRIICGIISFSMVLLLTSMINLYKYYFSLESKWDNYSTTLQILYFLYKQCLRLFLMHFGIIPFNFKYSGEYDIEDSCPMLISLHYAYTDHVFAVSLYHTSFLQSRYLYESFIHGSISRVEDNIPVNKQDSKDKSQALYGIYKHLHKYYEKKGNYNRLFVYPEGGHAGYNEYLFPFKVGAFSALAPMKLVKLNYYYDPITRVYPSNFRSIFEEYIISISRSWLVIEFDFSETLYPDHYIDYNLPYEEMIAEIKHNLDQYKQWSQEYMEKVSAEVNKLTGVEFLPSFYPNDCDEAKEFWKWVYANNYYKTMDLLNKSIVIECVKQWVQEGNRDAYLEQYNPSTYRTSKQIMTELEFE